MKNRRFSHITPRYIKNRFLVFYDQYKNPNAPWITANSVHLLRQLLKKSDIGVEFGSGRSTVWFAKRMKHLTSIENDKVWYEKVKSMISAAGLSSVVDYRKCEDEDVYARQASMFPDNALDFCLIDGIVRDKCALSILPKIKSGGLIVVDNVNWYLPNDWTHSPDSIRSKNIYASNIWTAFAKEVSSWRRIWTTNGVSDTCIWFRP